MIARVTSKESTYRLRNVVAARSEGAHLKLFFNDETGGGTYWFDASHASILLCRDEAELADEERREREERMNAGRTAMDNARR